MKTWSSAPAQQTRADTLCAHAEWIARTTTLSWPLCRALSVGSCVHAHRSCSISPSRSWWSFLQFWITSSPVLTLQAPSCPSSGQHRHLQTHTGHCWATPGGTCSFWGQPALSPWDSDTSWGLSCKPQSTLPTWPFLEWWHAWKKWVTQEDIVKKKRSFFSSCTDFQ